MHVDNFDTHEQGGKVDLNGLRQRGVLANLVNVTQAQQSVALEAGALLLDIEPKRNDPVEGCQCKRTGYLLILAVEREKLDIFWQRMLHGRERLENVRKLDADERKQRVRQPHVV